VSPSESDSDGLISTLSQLPSSPNGTYINPIGSSNPNVIIENFKMLPGVSGVLMCLALAIMSSTSCEFMRKCFYNLFWFSHQIFAFTFIVLLCVHSLQGVIRKQNNLSENYPENCYKNYAHWSNENPVCRIPQFERSMPTSLIWIFLSLIVYLIERLIRFIRSLKRHKIENFTIHPSNVLEICISNRGPFRIKYRPGQYVYLNVKKLSLLEWHPFTITSSPNESYLSVHIRCVGDWTKKFLNQIKSTDEAEKLNCLSLDGPYGTCAEDIFKYEQVVLVGAGIGVTPYASILRHIWHILNQNGLSITLRKVYFFWICPSIDTFEWFGKLLKNLEIEMSNKNQIDLLEYKIYLTKGWSLKEAREIAENNVSKYDLFTGLRQKTNYGRPNFELFFKDLVAKNTLEGGQNKKIGVFFCGKKIFWNN
jgi:predicted ferric reductase